MIFQTIPLTPALYVVATPLGNARDITLRAMDILASADVLVAEDTRTLRKLMQIHGIPLNSRRLMAFHDHSGPAQIDFILHEIGFGKSIALTSDAGTPLISDPGYELVKAARDAGVIVTAAPGPSALTSALSISGATTDQFSFMGFLSAQAGKRESVIQDVQAHNHPVVFYESPKRLADTLLQIAKTCGAERRVIVCRELTKKFEEVLDGSAQELADRFAEKSPKGEIVLILCPADQQKVTEADIDAALVQALLTHRIKDAASMVAGAFNLPKRDVYQRALTLNQKDT